MLPKGFSSSSGLSSLLSTSVSSSSSSKSVPLSMSLSSTNSGIFSPDCICLKIGFAHFVNLPFHQLTFFYTIISSSRLAAGFETSISRSVLITITFVLPLCYHRWTFKKLKKWSYGTTCVNPWRAFSAKSHHLRVN